MMSGFLLDSNLIVGTFESGCQVMDSEKASLNRSFPIHRHTRKRGSRGSYHSTLERCLSGAARSQVTSFP